MPRQKKYHINLQQIPQFAEKIASGIKGGEIFALIGDLGAGKTTFVKSLSRQLKIKTPVTSPTFILLAVHKGKTRQGKALSVYHLDLYRLKNPDELTALGIAEVWGDPDTLTLVEWADKFPSLLPKKTRFIFFT